MRVLVAASSKHGATREIAAEIGSVLEDRGLDVLVMRLEDVFDVAGFDAYVLGSAVYAGRWMGEARRSVDQHAAEPAEAGRGIRGEARRRARKTGAREHHLFSGRLDRRSLGLGERTVVRMVGAEDGDYRDWDDVRGWGASIADALAPASQRPFHGST